MVGVGSVVILIVLIEYTASFTSFEVYSAYTMASGVMRMAVDFRSICWTPMLRYAAGCFRGSLTVFPFVGMLDSPAFLEGILAFVLFTMWM